MKDRNCSSLMRCASSLQRLFFLALLSIIAIGAYAQGKTVSGTVLDKSGESVIGASVVVKGTTNGPLLTLTVSLPYLMYLMMLRLKSASWATRLR